MTIGLLAVTLALAVQDDRPSLFGVAMTTQTVWTGDQSGGVEKDFVAVRNWPQWDALRAKLNISDEDNKKLRSLHGPLEGMDWNKDQLVFAKAGQRPTGGYKVSVVRAIKGRDSSTWRLDLKVTPPKKDEMTMQVLTSPYIVFRMRRVDGKPFVFVHER